jgi:formate/nitrite transporter FocA (FNT family)
MERNPLRFTVRSMMAGVAVAAAVLWLVAGTIRGDFWEGPPGYVVLASPFVFAAAVTIMVTLVQIRLERTQAQNARPRTAERSGHLRS